MNDDRSLAGQESGRAGRPIERLRLTTTSADMMRSLLGHAYDSVTPAKIGSAQHDVRFDLVSTQVGTLHSARLRFGVDVEFEMATRTDFVAATVRRGRIALSSARTEWRLDAEDVFSTTAAAGLVGSILGPDYAADTLRVPMATLQRVAADSGLDCVSALDPDRLVPVSVRSAERWRGITDYVVNGLDRLEQYEESGTRLTVADTAILRDHLLRTVAVGALTCFGLTGPGARPTAAQPYPAAVRLIALQRATDFIDAHAHEPLSITAVAAAAGIGVRRLQRAFSEHYGLTPKQYLTRVRLERVHQELESSSPGTGSSVAAIALRWGFAHPSRFSRTYRRRFGVLPSQTYRR